MGRRKIEIKAIKDDRNRSVTFLKRKGGLFKKAHELSVLCSVDVAVIIFGANKKLYEYSSSDMRDVITRYTYHGGPNEHKGPSDFNGGADDGSDEDGEGTPPHAEGMEPHMLPPHFPGQPPFPHLRHHTPSASPPIPNGAIFAQHAAASIQRGHTPQPIGSRPGSRNDMRRMGPMVQQVGPPPQMQGPAVNGFAYIPQPGIYVPPQGPPGPGPQPGQFPYPPPQAHPPHMQQYVEDRRSLPPSFPPQGPPPQGAPQHGMPLGPPLQRHSVSPPHPQPQQLPQHIPHSSPPPPQHMPMPMPMPMSSPPQPPIINEPPAPPPSTVAERIDTTNDRPAQPSLLLNTGVKRMPASKQQSIFTPIDENRSSLSKHLAAFSEKPELPRSQSFDLANRKSNPNSPPQPKRSDSVQMPKARTSISSIPDATFTPPTRQNSLRVGAARPRLSVVIPDEASDGAASASAAATSKSPNNGTSTDSNTLSTNPITILPPPSPSTSTHRGNQMLSAGAEGPPNPFARPAPKIDTPVSALPSRFLNNGEFLPSPSSFFNNDFFNSRNEGNTLPSPLNFATPVGNTGPSFLRDDVPPFGGKRKSPDMTANGPTSDPMDATHEPKRLKVE